MNHSVPTMCSYYESWGTSCSSPTHYMLYAVQSVDGAGLLADSNLTGTIPASLGTALPDLQLLSLRHNPGNLFMAQTHLFEH